MRHLLNLVPRILALLHCLQLAQSHLSISKCSNCTRGTSTLTCPSLFDKQFEVQLKAGHDGELNGFLNVECGEVTAVDFSLLDGCTLPTVTSVKFNYCPFLNESFTETFSKIGVETSNVKYLSVHYPMSGATVLDSDHLIGLTNLIYLNLFMTQLTSVTEDAFRYVTNLTRIDMLGNYLSSISENTFSNLENLKYLNLVNNSLTEIPGRLFSNLTSLEIISLGFNNLENVPDILFSELVNLKSVAFVGNRLQSIPEIFFINNTNLKVVNFRKNNLTEVPENLFAANYQLENLTLSNNKLSSLPVSLFNSSKAIINLEFDNNLLTELPESIFEKLRNLTKLKLSKNKLSSLPEMLLKDCSRLEEIDLASNLLLNLPSGFFQFATNLQVIRLNNNRLLNLPDKLFSNSFNLIDLHLQYNNLSKLTVNSFPNESVLKKINVSHNNLTTESIFEYDTCALNRQIRLELIELNYNRFTTFPEMELYNFVNLKKLSFEGNYIREVHFGQIFDLPNDSILNLKNNLIERIIDFRPALYGGKTINVFLKSNNLTCDCHIFDLTKQIQLNDDGARNSYDIVNNMHSGSIVPGDPSATLLIQDKEEVLCQSPKHFSNRRLTSVNLSELECPRPDCSHVCPCIFNPFFNLVTVNCNKKHLHSVPAFNISSRRSYTLDLSGNHITSFNLSSEDHILNLSLSDNNLTADDLQAENVIPPNLKFFDLSKNNLTYLSDVFLSELNYTTSLIEIDFTINPWKCNCKITPLHNFIQAHYMKVKNMRSVICHDEQKPLIDMTEEDICPLLQQPLILTTIGVITTLLILFAILGTVSFYHYRTGIKVWLFTHRMCLWFVTEDELDIDKQYDAFISYSHKDEEFVNNTLVHGLENGDPKYRVCLHYRDWIVGEFIQNQIMNSVNSSRRTIVVLSTNFIESVWGQMEFRAAHQKALEENTRRVIVIVYGEMPPEESLDNELRHYIKMHTYLKWGHPRFWENLRYAMPHPKHLLARRKSQNKHNLDRLELVTNGHCGQHNNHTVVV